MLAIRHRLSSTSQINRWNHLKQHVIKSERQVHYDKPYLLNEQNNPSQQLLVFKQLCHVIERGSTHPSYKGRIDKEKSDLKCTKNWLRRVKKRNKLKKSLPPLPANFTGDARNFYLDTAKALYNNYILRRSHPLIIENLPPNDKDKNLFFISDNHLQLVNDENIFFHRQTPSPETS
ncbi:hypothetical protein RhiirA5_428576 [Rhizophagus irregularis]|uniref:Uncharacterized protein n=1 Tax=Rhizophagus irregularis TaxID=588596 RepID=A0A2N0R6A9_9GLOM|nr:hypothetical protein RhiirA5_428576 [Rhizophagus irregularis]PKC58846.1 hypothetical protein RhiirA1_470365 [Rhizophagus irregularis]